MQIEESLEVSFISFFKMLKFFKQIDTYLGLERFFLIAVV